MRREIMAYLSKASRGITPVEAAIDLGVVDVDTKPQDRVTKYGQMEQSLLTMVGEGSVVQRTEEASDGSHYSVYWLAENAPPEPVEA